MYVVALSPLVEAIVDDEDIIDGAVALLAAMEADMQLAHYK